MKSTTESTPESTPKSTVTLTQRILVWDWPVRLGHWSMVVAFVTAWLTSESESLRLVHALAGGALVAIIAFRVIWGVIGTRHARFASFVRGPGAVAGYVRSLIGRAPQQHAGHNPAGGWAIVALLALGAISGLTGWLVYNDLGGHLFEELHEGAASFMLGVVLIHVAGVVFSSLRHRENLVRAMVSGYKQGPAADGIASARPLVAGLLIAWTLLASWLIAA